MRTARFIAISVGILLLTLLFSSCNNFFTSGDAIATMSVSPTSVIAASGQTITLTATGTTVNGDTKDVTSSAKWTSSNNSVATVSAGTVTTVGAGTATITVSQDNGSATTKMTIIASPLQTTSPITVTPSSPNVSAGSTQQFKAVGNLNNGQTIDLTNLVSWSSSNTSVATVNSSGLASGVTIGTATITASITVYSGGSSSTASGTATMNVQ